MQVIADNRKTDPEKVPIHLKVTLTGYTGAVKPPVRRTGNRES